MARLRLSMPIRELRDPRAPKEREEQAADYDAKRGGWYPPEKKLKKSA